MYEKCVETEGSMCNIDMRNKKSITLGYKDITLTLEMGPSFSRCVRDWNRLGGEDRLL